ncbi:hypothetical protein Zm00014a_026640, partial [Zea mays]
TTSIQGFSESRYTRTRKSRRLFFFGVHQLAIVSLCFCPVSNTPSVNKNSTVFTSSIPHPVDKSSVVSSSASEKVQRNRNKND